MMRTHARCVRSVAGEYRRSLGAGRLLVGGTARLCARAQRKVRALPPIAPCMARSGSIFFLRVSGNGSVTCPCATNRPMLFMITKTNRLNDYDLKCLERLLDIDDNNLYNFYNGLNTDIVFEDNKINNLFKNFKY